MKIYASFYRSSLKSQFFSIYFYYLQPFNGNGDELSTWLGYYNFTYRAKLFGSRCINQSRALADRQHVLAICIKRATPPEEGWKLEKYLVYNRVYYIYWACRKLHFTSKCLTFVVVRACSSRSWIDERSRGNRVRESGREWEAERAESVWRGTWVNVRQIGLVACQGCCKSKFPLQVVLYRITIYTHTQVCRGALHFKHIVWGS